MASHTPPLKKVKKGNAITQPQSHPIPKFYIFLNGMGLRLGNVCSYLSELNPLILLRIFFFTLLYMIEDSELFNEAY